MSKENKKYIKCNEKFTCYEDWIEWNINNRTHLEGDCIIWDAGCRTGGNPCVYYNNEKMLYICKVINEEINKQPKAQFISHTCGNNKCLNKDHIVNYVYPKRPRPHTSAESRFWKYVNIPENKDDCWLWTGSNAHGYGKIKTDTKSRITAHRLSYIMHKGQIPNGLYVCHRCDVRPCVNPNHLFLGTSQDNNIDMLLKKRDNKRKLTDEQISEIRNSRHVSVHVLKHKFNVHQATIYNVWANTSFKWLKT